MTNSINFNESQSCEIPTGRVITKPVRVMRFLLKIYSLFSLKKASFFANKLWFTPMRYKYTENAMEFLRKAKIEDVQIQINNKSIALYSWGEGDKTVLLVHGWAGNALQMKNFIEPLVNAGYKVLAFDAPAHGLSKGKTSHIGEFSEAINKINETVVSIDSIIAHSLGGAAVARCLANGLDVEGVVFIGSIANLETCVKDFQYLLGLSKKVILQHCGLLEKRFGEDVWDAYSIDSLLRGNKTRGLLIHDKDDREVSYHNSLRIKESWTGADAIFTNNLGHRKILKDAQVVDKVCSFINS